MILGWTGITTGRGCTTLPLGGLRGLIPWQTIRISFHGQLIITPNNNPIRFIDPDGRNPIIPVAAAWVKRKLIWEGIKAVAREMLRPAKAPEGWTAPPDMLVPPVTRDVTDVVRVEDLTDPSSVGAERTNDQAPDEIDWENPPANPSELSSDWEDVTHPEKAKNTDNRDFKNKNTGEEITFDKGKEDKPGCEGKDHWHRHNPNSSSKGDKNLDTQGNPVPKGSKKSHIVPKTN